MRYTTSTSRPRPMSSAGNPHKGAVTHHQLQVMCPVSFSPVNRRNSSPKSGNDTVTFVLTLSLIFLSCLLSNGFVLGMITIVASHLYAPFCKGILEPYQTTVLADGPGYSSEIAPSVRLITILFFNVSDYASTLGH